MYFLEQLKNEFNRDCDKRARFLKLHINSTIFLSVGYILAFAYLGSWISMTSVAIYLTLVAVVRREESAENSYDIALSISLSFVAVPLICIALSGADASPYLSWAITPLFSTAAILGYRAIFPVTILVAVALLTLSLFAEALSAYNELPPDMYRPMALLSTLSAAAFLALFVRKHGQIARHASEELQTSNDAIAERNSVLDRAGFGHVVITVDDHRILDCDATWAKMAYAPYPECIGTDRLQYFRNEESKSAFQKFIDEAEINRSYWDMIETTDSSGGPRWIERIAHKLPATVEYPERITVFNRDVTEIMEGKRALERSLNQLTELSTKNRNVYGVIAHELRTPVAAIEMLARQSPQEWSESQSIVLNATSDLLHTIDDMKLLVNPDLKRQKHIVRTTVDSINPSISSMVASTVATTGMLYQQMTVLPDSMEGDEFQTDAYRIKAAVTNLIRNACLHSEGTRVVMYTGLSLGEAGQRFLKWVVRDNGKGIPDERVPDLFEPFSRGDSKAEGTGLGLHIAKTWIEEIGGSLTYKRLDKGSEFTIVVPFDVGPDHADADADGLIIESAKSTASSMSVLLVEDDKVLQMVVRKLLAKLFKKVDVANDGQEGLSKTHSQYDLILTDYFMPNMTGVEMIKQLREQGVSIPIVGATAATIAGQDEDMLVAGADAVLLKPLNAQMVLKTVAKLDQQGRLNSNRADNES